MNAAAPKPPHHAPPIRVALSTADVLGESPLWDDRRGVLWWCDIKRGLVQQLDPATGAIERRFVGGPVGALALTDAGDLLVASRSLHLLTIGDGTPLAQAPLLLLASLADEPRGNRCNDSRVDRRGVLWLGTMDDAEQERTGASYRVRLHGRVPGAAVCTARVERAWDGVGIPNSTCFSPAGDVAYWGDSMSRTIHRLPLDAAGLPIAPPSESTVFARTPADAAPDGSCVDADGALWNAEWGSGRIVRYLPDGTPDRVVQLPVTQATCPAFGGDGLGTLYVTTASFGLGADHRAQQPRAGCVFAIDVGAAWGLRGLPEQRLHTT